jgi:RNA polymerase sigma factor (sigma-70 family)
MTGTILPTDSELLAEYVRAGSKSAFEQIVNQHIHLVHAAAMRQVRDSHLAEDVTQAVFLLLWERAASMVTHTSLGGWLLVTTHHISANAMKKEWRLKNREQKAAQMNHEQGPSSPSQTDPILPLLDSGMAQLGEADRDAIVERFFHSRSLDEVGAILGVSQQAAAKRISRAIEKLRGILARRGVKTSDATLSALLPAVALHPGASPSLVSAVLAGPGVAVSASVASLARGAVRPWSAMLTKIAATGTVLLGLGGIAYLAVVLQNRPPATPQTAVAAQAMADAAQVDPLAVPSGRIVALTLVDAKTGAPLTGGGVELEFNGNRGPSLPAGADGKYELRLAGNYQYARAICRVPGRVAMYLEFQNSTFKGDLPAEYTVPMEPGMTIGGIVLSDIGDPLVGAKVRISTFISGNADAPHVWLNENLVTGPDGKWHVDGAPAKLDQIFIEVSHHDYSHSQQSSQLSADQLHRGVYETVMRADDEKQLTGVVLGPDGNAVQGAQVVIANDRYESNKPTTSTDADGKFALAAPKSQWDTYATVMVKGFAPEQVKILGSDNAPAAKADAKPLEIRLSQSVKLQGTVVDNNGKPVNGATVEVERWRNNRALKWTTRTDRSGNFVWNDAPADAIQLNVYHRNMGAISGVEVKAGGDPIRLTLFPPLKITGNVIDTASKEPIPAFRIVEGIRWTGQQDVTWQPQSSRKLGNGKYEATIGDFSNGGKLRVEADGYLPAESRMIQKSEGSIQLDFELKKGTGLSGIVLDPNGKPLFNVRVVCVPEDQSIYLDPDHDNLADRTGIALAQTDKDGHFSLQPQEKKYSLLITADEGFALVKDDQLSKDGQIHLQKWARIEGDYRLNASPASFVKIGAQAQLPLGPYGGSMLNARSVTTDASGHFVLDHLPPGQNVHIYQLVPLGGGSERFVQMGDYKAVADQTTAIQVGGKGRPVIGKLSLPATGAAQVDFTQQVNVRAESSNDAEINFMRQLPFPENFPDMPQDQQEQWYQTQIKSHVATQAAMQKSGQSPVQSVDFVVSSDGTMRADNVVPGTYRGQATFREPFVPGSNHQDVLGTAPISFTVPITPAYPTNEPLDIGVIRLTPPSTMEIGKPLSNVPLVTLDGQTVDPSAWAGKIVVLHLWEMHDHKFFPAIEQLADKFKDDPRIQIVNVGMEMLPTWAKHIDAKDHLPGLQVLEKDSSELNIRSTLTDHAWMIQGLPFVLILDPQGNVTAKVSNVKELSTAVEKATAK